MSEGTVFAGSELSQQNRPHKGTRIKEQGKRNEQQGAGTQDEDAGHKSSIHDP